MVLMGPYMPLCVLMDSKGSLWGLGVLQASFMILMDPYRSLCILMHSTKSSCVLIILMDSIGSL